jgi:hypothetical protein
MNKCCECGKETINKLFCCFECRDRNRKKKAYENRKCEVCGTAFECRKKSKKKFCSLDCSAKHKSMNKDVLVKRMKQTKLEKYGDENYTNVKKLKKTCLEKYGVESFSKTKMFKEKFTSTMLERHGVEYAQQSPDIKNKTKSTVIKKYGGFTFESGELSSKAKTTMLEKYGYDNPMKNSEICEKVKNTNKDKYGGNSPMCDKSIQEKSKSTVQKRYNVDNISKSPENKEKVRNHHINEFLDSVFCEDRLQNRVIPLFSRESYKGAGWFEKYKFKCNKCEQDFEDTLFSGNIPRCPKCYPSTYSLGEQQIKDYMESLKVCDLEFNRRYLLDNQFEIDIFDKNTNIGIEFHGLYYHSEISGGKDKKYHLKKLEKCLEKNIHLIQIFENEWFYKEDIVKSIINSKLNFKMAKIFGRKCDIREISSSESGRFLEKNHIQGKDKSSIRFGLYHGGELVSVMTFCKSRFDKNIEYEMSRFCNKLNSSVIGGASKLFKYFIEHCGPRNIVTYSDRRFFEGSVYKHLGFKYITATAPSYFYQKRQKLFNRQSFQKHMLRDKLDNFNPNLTEWENMKNNGYDRVWDCGTLKYIWEND